MQFIFINKNSKVNGISDNEIVKNNAKLKKLDIQVSIRLPRRLRLLFLSYLPIKLHMSRDMSSRSILLDDPPSRCMLLGYPPSRHPLLEEHLAGARAPMSLSALSPVHR